MRVLVVEDEASSRALIQKFLRDVAECEPAENGSCALASFTQALDGRTPFDLMTLDYSMPEMDGIDVLRKVRHIEQQKQVPKEKQIKILMMTGQVDKNTIIECIKAGCDDYIAKPIRKEVILQKVEKFGFDTTKQRRESLEDKQETQEPSQQKTPGKEVWDVLRGIMRFYESGEVDLPVFPRLIDDILCVMNNPSSSVDDLARVVSRDPALSLKLLSIANSALLPGSPGY